MSIADSASSIDIQARHPFYVPLEREAVEPLDGEWRFRPDPEDLGDEQQWFRTGVRDWVCSMPSAWQFVFDDLRDYRGPAES